MEICDVIKQADEKTFETSLAPFLGGNYDRADKRNREKIDGVMNRKAKQTNLLKSAITSKLSSPAVNPSSEADFIPKLDKKHLKKSNYKDRLSDFAMFTETALKTGTGDDTLADVDSILFDDTDNISASRTVDNLVPKKVGKNTHSDTAVCNKLKNTNEEKRRSKIFPKKKLKIRHAQKRSWGDDDDGDSIILSDTEEVKMLAESTALIPACDEDGLKTKKCVSSIDPPPAVLDDANRHSPCANESQKSASLRPSPSNKYQPQTSGLGISDDLSVLATPIHISDKPCTSAEAIQSSPGLRIPTPPSFNSESLDFLNDFVDPSSEDSEDEKRSKKPLSKMHFALGNEKIKQSKLINEADISMNPEPLRRNLSHSIAEESNTLPENPEPFLEGRMSVETFSNKENSEPASRKDTSHQSSEFRNYKRNATGHTAISDSEANHITDTDTISKQMPDGKEEQYDSEDIINLSEDLFEVNFDFASDVCTPQKEGLDITSPILLSKNSTNKLSSRDCEFSEIPSVEKKLASAMLSQRSENRALFADWPESDVDIPVAEVKPTKSSSSTEDAYVPDAKRDPSPKIDHSCMDLFGETPRNASHADLQVKDSLKRKRKEDCNHDENSFQLFKRKRATQVEVEAYLSENVDDVDIPIPDFNFGNISDDSKEESPVAAKQNRPKAKNSLFSPHISCRNEVWDSDDEDILISQLPLKNMQRSFSQVPTKSQPKLVSSTVFHKGSGVSVSRKGTVKTHADSVTDDDFASNCERPAKKSLIGNFKHKIKKVRVPGMNVYSKAKALYNWGDMGLGILFLLTCV